MKRPLLFLVLFGLPSACRAAAPTPAAQVAAALPVGLSRHTLEWQGVDDVDFLRAMVADIGQAQSLDPARIYVAGMSNGAMMAHRLACEASDLVAAAAAVAGTLPRIPCQPQGAVSILLFHGEQDQHVPYLGGVDADSIVQVDFHPVPETIRFWVENNGCAEPPFSEEVFGATRQVWNDCRDGTAVETYLLPAGGHAWPGGQPGFPGADPPPPEPPASLLITDFFSAHPRR